VRPRARAFPVDDQPVTKVCVVAFLLGAAFATGVALLVWWCVRWRA